MTVESVPWMEKNWDSLRLSLSHHIENKALEIVDCHVAPLHKNVNFTTYGIYRFHGTANVDHQLIAWSIILKIIKPDSEEKNETSHHNYWKREALVHDAGVLSNVPKVISVPKCYLIEEKTDGTVWIWLEEIRADNDRPFSEDEWAFIARQVGFFNGSYISNIPFPTEPWICRQWLRSWVISCKKYALDPFQCYEQIKNEIEAIDSIWDRFTRFNMNMEKYISTLNLLPRVLAHQDLSKGNMYISNTSHGRRLTLIDWQFMSLSGVGEDLGKLFGVAMSQNNIPRDDSRTYKDVLFQNYLEGLIHAGWEGDDLIPRYGFCVSVAARSVWEIPKLLGILVDSKGNKLNLTQENEIEKLVDIVNIHMDCADEAEMLIQGPLATLAH